MQSGGKCPETIAKTDYNYFCGSQNKHSQILWNLPPYLLICSRLYHLGSWSSFCHFERQSEIVWEILELLDQIFNQRFLNCLHLEGWHVITLPISFFLSYFLCYSPSVYLIWSGLSLLDLCGMRDRSPTSQRLYVTLCSNGEWVLLVPCSWLWCYVRVLDISWYCLWMLSPICVNVLMYTQFFFFFFLFWHFG